MQFCSCLEAGGFSGAQRAVVSTTGEAPFLSGLAWLLATVHLLPSAVGPSLSPLPSLPQPVPWLPA